MLRALRRDVLLGGVKVRSRDLRARFTEETPGLFTVGARTGGDRPGVVPHVGLLLPLSLCSDARARAALGDIPALIDNPQSAMSERRRAVQSKLDEAFGGDLLIADKESLDGYFALRPGPGQFHRLSEAFDYVTDVVDNPADTVRITGTARFNWRSYGELMEWYHGLRGSDRFGDWSALTPASISIDCRVGARCRRVRSVKADMTNTWQGSMRAVRSGC